MEFVIHIDITTMKNMHVDFSIHFVFQAPSSSPIEFLIFLFQFCYFLKIK
jgi:hypothetical protein